MRDTTASVPAISERDFAKLDRLIREKPNASTLALEAHILFTNKTSGLTRNPPMKRAINGGSTKKCYQQRISSLINRAGAYHTTRTKREAELKPKKRCHIRYGKLWPLVICTSSRLLSLRNVIHAGDEDIHGHWRLLWTS